MISSDFIRMTFPFFTHLYFPKNARENNVVNPKTVVKLTILVPYSVGSWSLNEIMVPNDNLPMGSKWSAEIQMKGKMFQVYVGFEFFQPDGSFDVNK